MGLEILTEVNLEITVRLDVLTANNVEIPCKIQDTAATVEIAVGFGDSNGSECGDYCEIRCSNRKEFGDSLQDTRHSCDRGDFYGFWRFKWK